MKEAAADPIGRIKPALIAICGPMMPVTTPEAMTHEIARGLNAGSAASAAAKRYCWMKAPEAPMAISARTKAMNEPERIARAAAIAPAAPIRSADDEAGAAADALHEERGRDRGERRADDEGGDRQRLRARPDPAAAATCR